MDCVRIMEYSLPRTECCVSTMRTMEPQRREDMSVEGRAPGWGAKGLDPRLPASLWALWI